MTLFAATPSFPAAGQIALAAGLAAVGFFLLLPKPRGRSVAGGIAAVVAAAAVFGVWLYQTFGNPMPDAVGSVLFGLFSLGALVFGTVLVTQRNPARGAIAFAFVILSTCGLFLLLAAPFLMAATIIIYAGAIIVTFLFVLMLSRADGPSDENDRTREPLYGSLAGFAFTGLVLFTLYQSHLGTRPAAAAETAPRFEPRLPAPVLTAAERQTLAGVIDRLREADDRLHGELTAGRKELAEFFGDIERSLEQVVGVATGGSNGSVQARLVNDRGDPQAMAVLDRVAAVRVASGKTFKAIDDTLLGPKPDVAAAKAELRALRGEVQLLAGAGELPARNVGTLGMVLYTDHLLAVELAGTLLLVATIGAVAIAQRRKGAAE